MRILVVKPGRKPQVQEINGTVEEMREIVGGALQAIYPADDVALVFNESAKALQSPPNRGVLNEDGTFCDIVYGTFFMCAAPENSNYFKSITAEQVQRYTEIFATPEVFRNLGGRTIILPCAEIIDEDTDHDS